MKQTSNFYILPQLFEAFRLIVSHPFIFLGITFISAIPFSAVLLTSANTGYETFIIELVFYFCFLSSMGAIAKAVVDIQNDGSSNIGKCLKAGFSKVAEFFVFLPIILFFILIISIFSGAVIAIFHFLFYSRIAVVIIVCLVTSLFLSIFSLTVPVIVLEQKSTFQSLKRSTELTSGKILKIALFVLLFYSFTALALVFVFNQNNYSFSLNLITSGFLARQLSIKFIAIYLVLSPVLFVTCGVFYKTCYMLNESKKVEDLANIF